MKKIAQGLQYNVYSKNENKVIKTPTSKTQIILKLLSWNPRHIFKPSLLRKTLNQTIIDRKNSIENIKKIPFDKKILANPIFKLNKIEQDKVIILEKFLKENPEKAKQYINKYIESIFQTWSYGFSDRIFNLTINNGIDKTNKVVLIDFGELTFKKEDVIKAINTTRWEKSWSFKKDLNKEVKEYYKKEMKEKITLSNLDRYWKSH